MTDSDLAGFGFDPRAIRYPYSPRVSWPAPSQNQLGSPQGQNIGANANAVKRSTTPLQNQRANIQPMTQQHRLRPHSQGNEQSYTRLSRQQNGLPPQLQPQTHLPFDQHIGQQHVFGSPYPNQPQPYQPPMTSQPIFPSDNQSTSSDWSYQQQQQQQQQPSQQPQSSHPYPLDTSYTQPYPDQYMPYGSSPVSFLPDQNQYAANMNTMDGTYLHLNTDMDGVPFSWQDLSTHFGDYPMSNGLPEMSLANQVLPSSPTDTSLEVRSLSSSDNGWASVEYPQGFGGSFQDGQTGAIFNPGQTLHGRTFSDSSYSDIENQSRFSWGSYVDIPQHAIGSPSSDSAGDHEFHRDIPDTSDELPIKPEKLPTPVLSSSTTAPIKIKPSKSPQRSPASARRTSPPGRRPPRKNSMKTTKAAIKRQGQLMKGETEKRVGRRKGPLRPDQRKQASEIRKMGACLRCKFLKKTCDTGEPCQGCLPSHARLWQVPCTRIDIKEIAYFMRDWKADYERHVSLGFSIDNIKGFAESERILFITHGYGHLLPVRAREVFVRDERCFGLDWVETLHEFPTEHSMNTAKMSAGMDGVSLALLSDYLDAHVDEGYENFVDQYFEGTPFVTEMLHTAYRFYQREETPVIKKALKFLLAYNLTQHVTMVEGIPDEEGFLGKINDKTSKLHGKTVAPVMINFQVKVAMANMWRELQKDILDELSSLYSSVYSKDKLKHWPTIFMVASILLAVWEEMQFDCHYRVPDREAVNKFCTDMESTPIGVIVGLFATISQKLPALQEWDTRKHHHLLNSNPAICHALTEVRQHVTRHGMSSDGHVASEYHRLMF
ncbi:MAG: hypothetical protein Q9217_006621 [Psora testacea]